MWKELIDKIGEGCQFLAPIDHNTINQAEERLSIKLPDDLRDLLLETNGIWGPSGSGLIWAAEKTISENITFRTFSDFRELYMPFDHLLFFADDGSGDQFAFRILAGKIRYQDVYRWVHEND